MIEVLIFLAAAVICVPLARRLGLGSVLGYLIAGALIGPWGLRLIADVEATRHLSEFGVVLMLFVIGLELEPRRLWSMRSEVFGGGSLQLAITGIALAVAGIAIGLEWKTALVAGLALALSSTAIAMQTMAERNFTATPTGRSGFAILLFQDIAAIPLLATVPLLAAQRVAKDGSVWYDAATAFAAIVGVIVIGRYLTRPLLRLIAKVDMREVFTAFALLLVVGIAQLMSLAGVSMALGAFLAGVLLAGSEYRHALETDIEPFKGLLLGLFFISVGMSIDFGLLRSQPLTVLAMVSGFLALKLVSLYIVARIIGVTSRQRWLFSVLLSQGGEFAFVVFGAARLAGLLSIEWDALLTMTVALSMATTPLLLMLYDWWICPREKAAADRQPDEIDETGPVIIAGFGRFGQIVGRLLGANRIRYIVLDHDPDQIDAIRRFGYKVFYGDATRLDLLRAAGASNARLLVNAIDDIDDSIKVTDIVRENFPDLTMIARARNVSHFVELRSRGVTIVERETFESALKAGRHVLESLGVDPYRARELADIFRRRNIAFLESAIPLFHDENRYLSAARAGREELERNYANDRQRFEKEHGDPEWR